MLSDREHRFLAGRPVGHLATADARADPHVVPVCFAIDGGTLYITIDEKPKKDAAQPLKRLRNIAANPRAAIVVDRYDTDWSRLGWVMLRGRAEIIDHGPEQAHAQALLRERYPQYQAMRLEGRAVIAIRLERVTSWGNIDEGDEP